MQQDSETMLQPNYSWRLCTSYSAERCCCALVQAQGIRAHELLPEQRTYATQMMGLAWPVAGIHLVRPLLLLLLSPSGGIQPHLLLTHSACPPAKRGSCGCQPAKLPSSILL